MALTSIDNIFSMAFAVLWRTGRRVIEVKPPNRQGSIKQTIGTGPNAKIVVNLDGGVPASFHPADLKPVIFP